MFALLGGIGPSLRKKCPSAELFLVRIFLYSDWIRGFVLECRAISRVIFKYFGKAASHHKIRVNIFKAVIEK